MINQFLSDEKKAHVKNHLLDYLRVQHPEIKDLKKNFRCLNPAHLDETPSMGIYRSGTDNFERCHCFGCGVYYDTFDLIKIDFGIESDAEAFQKGYEIFGLNDENARSLREVDVPKTYFGEKPRLVGLPGGTLPEKKEAPEPEIDFTENAKTAYKTLMQTPAALKHYRDRGLTDETIRRFKLGYRPDDRHPYIFPHIDADGKCRYIVSEIAKRDPNNPNANKYQKPKGLKGRVYNDQYLKPGNEPPVLFVCEGIYDALSVEQAGGKAVALVGVADNALLELIKNNESIRDKTVFLVCTDNDKTGNESAERICEHLDELGCVCKRALPKNKDFNEDLLEDEAALCESVREKEMKALKVMEEQGLDKETGQQADAADTLPGLLVYDELVKEFQEADDEIIELKSFPQFSKAAKIKKHSTIALAADTGGGKSSLSLNFLNDLNSEYPCIYFNLEMDRLTVLRRLVAIQSGLELDVIEGYKNDPMTEKAVNIYLKTISSRQPLQVVQDEYLLEKIEAVIRDSTKGRETPTIVVIDHGLLVEIGGHTVGRYERFTIISEQLRKMALRYNIVLFVLLQQNRVGKEKEEERPKNSSLKESGSWENDATHICFLWYDPAAMCKKLLLTKSRNSDPGEFALDYWSRTQTYAEAKEQPAVQTVTSRATGKQSKRERTKERLLQAYNEAVIVTDGVPTLHAMAEAADVTTATVKSWIKEYGGCTIDGKTVDPAGIDVTVECSGFIKLTPGESTPFEPAAESGSKLKRFHQQKKLECKQAGVKWKETVDEDGNLIKELVPDDEED